MFAEGKSRKLRNNPIPNCKKENVVTLKFKTGLLLRTISIMMLTYTELGKSLDNLKNLVKEDGTSLRKQHKLWCDKELSEFVDQRKKTKLQYSQLPNHTNAHNRKM